VPMKTRDFKVRTNQFRPNANGTKAVHRGIDRCLPRVVSENVRYRTGDNVAREMDTVMATLRVRCCTIRELPPGFKGYLTLFRFKFPDRNYRVSNNVV
ncbi:MAG: hypothetical protein ABJA67_08050, partial [Chthonomonadales bacterium]